MNVRLKDGKERTGISRNAFPGFLLEVRIIYTNTCSNKLFELSSSEREHYQGLT